MNSKKIITIEPAASGLFATGNPIFIKLSELTKKYPITNIEEYIAATSRLFRETIKIVMNMQIEIYEIDMIKGNIEFASL